MKRAVYEKNRRIKALSFVRPRTAIVNYLATRFEGPSSAWPGGCQARLRLLKYWPLIAERKSLSMSWQLRGLVAIFIGHLAAAIVPTALAQPPDLILHHGKIATVDKA